MKLLMGVVVILGPIAALFGFAGHHERDDFATVGTPTAIQAAHPGYVRGECSGHFTRWVGEYLTPESFAAKAKRSDDFRADPDVPHEFRASAGDYALSGYDLGHLAPAGDNEFSDAAMHASFLVSNMCPQRAGLNRENAKWEGLEDHVRSIAKTDGAKVWVFTGPAFLPDADGKVVIETIGAHAVWVPTHCFKAIYARVGGKSWMEAFLMPNTTDPPRWQDCRESVDALERAVGLDFFAALDDATEERLEAAKPKP